MEYIILLINRNAIFLNLPINHLSKCIYMKFILKLLTNVITLQKSILEINIRVLKSHRSNELILNTLLPQCMTETKESNGNHPLSSHGF